MTFWSQLGKFFRCSRRNSGFDVRFPDVVKSRRELMQVFDGLSDPVIVIDRSFIIQRLNRTALSALGKKSYTEVIGKPCYAAMHGRTERCPECTAAVTFANKERTNHPGFIETQKNHPTTVYHITSYPLANDDGEVEAIAEFYRDSTDIVHLTQKLYESERARVMEPLAAGLTHQVRQPLTVIRSGAQYVLDKFGKSFHNADFEETMASIVQNTDTINDVLSDFVHFSRPSLYQMKKGSLVKLLEQGLRLIRQQIKEKGIQLAKEWPRDLPEIMMDEKLLLQAYLNLLVNSLESMHDGGHLTVRAFVKDAESLGVFVEIQDTGVGIPRELVSKLKQPFFTTKEGGVGLGLPVAEGIVRTHGGQIRFESIEGKGTMVVIEFPGAVQ